jgi:hypothetical protein
VLPSLPTAGPDSSISEMVDADPLDWPGLQKTQGLSAQVLQQEGGHSIVLLHLPEAEPDTD